jgi:hypothetical protein
MVSATDRFIPASYPVRAGERMGAVKWRDEPQPSTSS